MIIFDGATVIPVLPQQKQPVEVYLQNRSASDVYVLDDQRTLQSSINPNTNIAADGFLIPYGGGIIHFRRFTGTLYGYSALEGGAVVVDYWPSDSCECSS